MVDIITRKEWGARYADGDNTIVARAIDVSIHHSCTKTLAQNATFAAECEQMRLIEKIGHDRFGWGISYNFVVFPSGRVYQGVSCNKRGQHTDGMNSSVRSICFAGNFDDHKPTQKALDSARALVAERRGDLWNPSANVFGHRDIKATACPGANLYPHLHYIATGVKPTPNKPTPKPVAPAPAPRSEFVTVNVNLARVNLTNAHKTAVRGNVIRTLQSLLIARGYNVGKHGIDGSGGPDTKAALGRFQTATNTGTNGKPDYICGPNTWSRLITG